MSPAASMRRQSSETDALWRASVVRMKSSLEQLSEVAISWNFGVICAMYSAAVTPALRAVCWIFWPCSSVPVRNSTS